MAYAQTTECSVEKSRNDIEKVLKKYGANSFVYATQDNKALIMFTANGKRIKFLLILPSIADKRFNIHRTQQTREKGWEQACRSKWRSLLLVIKAKLEAVESGISIFEEEFMANIILPDGHTVGEYMLPQIDNAYKNNQMPPLLDFGRK